MAVLYTNMTKSARTPGFERPAGARGGRPYTAPMHRRASAIAVLLLVSASLRAQAPTAPLIPAKDVPEVMKQFNDALGVECTHCHVQDQWKDASKPGFATARNMWRMVQALNADQLSNTKGVRCATCHAGQVKPSRLDPAAWMKIRDTQWPADLGGAGDQVKLAMSVYSASLGVECVHCHDPSDWKSDAKPAHAMTGRMNAMFEVFPKFMPAGARTQCFMCHKGQRAPK